MNAYDSAYRGRFRVKKNVKLDEVEVCLRSSIRKGNLLKQLRLRFLFFTIYFPWVFYQSEVGNCNKMTNLVSTIVLQSTFDVHRNIASFIPQKTYSQIETSTDYFSWLDQVVHDRIVCPQPPASDDHLRLPNRLIFGVSIRQVRAKNASLSNCYDIVGTQLCDYFNRVADKRVLDKKRPESSIVMGFIGTNEATAEDAYGPGIHSNNKTELIYHWHQAAVLKEKATTGVLATYPGSGFNFSLPVENCLDSKRHINTMQFSTTPYIDQNTRAIVTTFTVFNPEVNVFVTTKSLVEFSAVGAVWSKVDFTCSPGILNSSQHSKMVVFGTFVNLFAAFSVLITLRGIKFMDKGWVLVEVLVCCLILWQLHSVIVYFFLFDVKQFVGDGGVFEAVIRERAEEYVTSQQAYAWTILLESILGIKVLGELTGFDNVMCTSQKAILRVLPTWMFYFLFMLTAYGIISFVAFGGVNDNALANIGSWIEEWLMALVGDLQHNTLFSADITPRPLLYSSFVIVFLVLLPVQTQAIVLSTWYQNESGCEVNVYTKSQDNGQMDRATQKDRSTQQPRVRLDKQIQDIVNLINEGLRNPAQQLIPNFLVICHRLFGTPIPGWLPKTQVLSRIEHYRKHAAAESTYFVNFQELRAILQGEGTNLPYIQVNNYQVDSILRKVKDRYRDEERLRILHELEQTNYKQTKSIPGGGDREIVVTRVKHVLRGLSALQGEIYMLIRTQLDSIRKNQIQVVNHLSAAKFLVEDKTWRDDS